MQATAYADLVIGQRVLYKAGPYFGGETIVGQFVDRTFGRDLRLAACILEDGEEWPTLCPVDQGDFQVILNCTFCKNNAVVVIEYTDDLGDNETPLCATCYEPYDLGRMWHQWNSETERPLNPIDTEKEPA
jgi:hypothetical protein